MRPFLAMITPVGDNGPVDPGYSPPWAQVPGGGGQPPGIWGPTDPRPSNPIAGPGRPPWWGMAQDPGYGIPGGIEGTRPPPGSVDPGWGVTPPVDPGYSPPWARPPVDPGYSPPWARPQPPGIWGPTDPRPTPPIAGPGRPPGWGMANDPNYGIEIPQPPTKPPSQGGVPIHLPAQNPDQGGWVYAYVPGYGWMWIEVANDPQAPPPTHPPATTKPNPDEKPPVEVQPA